MGVDYRYFIGLDLGQTQDYTALAIVERHKPEEGTEPTYSCGVLKRKPLGTLYTDIVADTKKLLVSAPLHGACRLVVDATGVGKAVVDMFTQQDLDAPVTAVVIHGGRDEKWAEGRYLVPQRNLIGTLQVMLQSGTLKIAGNVPDVKVLVEEMLNFQVKISEAGHDSYGALREGEHDDYIYALALACWEAKRTGGQVVTTFRRTQRWQRIR